MNIQKKTSEELAVELRHLQAEITLLRKTSMKEMAGYKEEAEKLQKLNSGKDKFISIISHELKNPFNTILGFSELLLEKIREKDYEGMEEYATFVNHSSKHAVNLVQDLTDWSRSKSERIDLIPENFDLEEVIREVTLLFQEISVQKSVNIQLNLARDTAMFADQAMISTILRNLVSNAIKFTNPGNTITISTSKDEKRTLVSVSDTGIGIPANLIRKLFRLEEIFSTPGTGKEKGTGLGLILCKEYVDKHKGEIWVESEQNKGTTFNFTIPVA